MASSMVSTTKQTSLVVCAYEFLDYATGTRTAALELRRPSPFTRNLERRARESHRLLQAFGRREASSQRPSTRYATDGPAELVPRLPDTDGCSCRTGCRTITLRIRGLPYLF